MPNDNDNADKILAAYYAQQARVAAGAVVGDDFGTVAGYHTASELTAQYDVTQAWVQAVTKIRDNLAASGAWANANPTAWAQWLIDVANMQNEWQTKSANAQTYMSGVASADLPLVDAYYTALATLQTTAGSLAYRAEQGPAGQSPDVTGPLAGLTQQQQGSLAPIEQGLVQSGQSDPFVQAGNALPQLLQNLGNAPLGVAPPPATPGGKQGKHVSGFSVALIAGSMGLMGGLGFSIAGPYGALAGLALGAFVGDAVKNQIAAITPSWL